MSDTLYVVVPCYNEEEVLYATAARLGEKLLDLAATGRISDDYKTVFVDDGSRDDTWGIIEQLCESNEHNAGVKLSRNRGHQNALFAGLMYVKDDADMVISIDADLQDDVDAMDEMVDAYISGSEIVYGVRRNRDSDGFFKRTTARCYYRLLRSLGCDVMFDHADFRLMGSRALDALSEYGEQRLFVRGLVPLLGYKTSTVHYTRAVREAGKSKYPLKRMLTLAMDGIMSLSLRPLRIVAGIGMLMFLISAVFLLMSVIDLRFRSAASEWKIIAYSIWTVGGIVTLALGIVGEYVGRIYTETKRRPRYNIETTINVKRGS